MGNPLTISIGHKYFTELVPSLDEDNYFMLSKPNCPRLELFDFALALGYYQNYTSQLDGRETFIRTEYLGNARYLYDSVYFNDHLKDDQQNIDDIVDSEKVFKNAEVYANTGFSVIKDKMKEVQADTWMYELIDEMDDLYNQFEADQK